MLHDFDKNRDSLINYMIITGCHKTIKEVCKAKREDGKTEVLMTVNGVEMDVQQFMDRWQDNVDRLVEEKAKELLREKFGDMDDVAEQLAMTISDFEKSIGEVIKKQLKTWGKTDD